MKKRFPHLLPWLLLLASQTTLANGPLPDFPFLTVSAEAKNDIPPDRAEIRFQIQAFDAKSKKAIASVNKTAALISAYLLKQGLTKQDIEAYEFSKNAKRKRDRDYNSLDIIGYDVSQQFSVTLTKLTKYDEISQKLLSTQGIVNLNSTFGLSNIEEMEAKLIAQAAKKAKARATLLAEGMGAKLSTIHGITEASSFPQFFATFGLQGQASHDQLRARALADFSEAGGAVFIPQFITVSKHVHVVYKISQF